MSSEENRKDREEEGKFLQYIKHTGLKGDLTEYHDSDLELKSKQLTEMIRKAKYCVFYTGAGISTLSGLPDYRGPSGVWTKRVASDETWKQDQARIYDSSIQPNSIHQGITTLVKSGYVKSVISINVDGLHVAAGLERKNNLIEMHGNGYIEICRHCEEEYYRKEPIPNISDRSHLTGGTCPECGHPLYNSIVLFGDSWETQPTYEHDHDRGFIECSNADLVVVWGSSLMVPSACNLPDHCIDRGGKLVIINKQKTGKDTVASLIIRGPCENVMSIILKELNL